MTAYDSNYSTWHSCQPNMAESSTESEVKAAMHCFCYRTRAYEVLSASAEMIAELKIYAQSEVTSLSYCSLYTNASLSSVKVQDLGDRVKSLPQGCVTDSLAHWFTQRVFDQKWRGSLRRSREKGASLARTMRTAALHRHRGLLACFFHGRMTKKYMHRHKATNHRHVLP
jgi:hypothetical protein